MIVLSHKICPGNLLWLYSKLAVASLLYSHNCFIQQTDRAKSVMQENHMHGKANLLCSEVILVAHLVPLMALITEISTKLM